MAWGFCGEAGTNSILTLAAIGNDMASGTLTEDGNTSEFTINGKATVNAYGDFGDGTLVLQKKVAGSWYSMAEDSGTAVFSVTDDSSKIIEGNHTCRLNLSSSTSPDIDWAVE